MASTTPSVLDPYKTPLGYVDVAPSHGDPVAVVLQDWSPSYTPAGHSWCRCWGGPTQSFLVCVEKKSRCVLKMHMLESEILTIWL